MWMQVVGFVSSVGFGSLLLIAFFALLIFGPKKLPDLGKAVGNTLREFKHATKGLADEDDEVKKIEKKEEVK
jgi:sec-independent protein translocase protein TatA